MTEKKRLKMLPEVLPSPQGVNANGPSPRARTMAHMQRLLAVAAAATGAMACPKEGASDIKADDSKTKTTVDPTSTATTAATTDPTSTAPTTTATPTNPGYVVVDPMPPPAMCSGAASTISTSASWKTSASGALGVEVHLRKSSRADVSYTSKAAPTAYSGTIVATSFSPSEVVITMVPDKGATYAGLYVPLACSAGDEHLNVQLELPAPPAVPTAGTPVKVTLYDSY
jgi:hypothetical protein